MLMIELPEGSRPTSPRGLVQAESFGLYRRFRLGRPFRIEVGKVLEWET